MGTRANIDIIDLSRVRIPGCTTNFCTDCCQWVYGILNIVALEINSDLLVRQFSKNIHIQKWGKIILDGHRTVR